MSRPNPPRTIGAEDRLKANVRQRLADEERSTAWLARRMTEVGCPVSPATVWKMLSTDRAVYVDEAVAIGLVLGTDTQGNRAASG